MADDFGRAVVNAGDGYAEANLLRNRGEVLRLRLALPISAPAARKELEDITGDLRADDA